jgi:hypothetical protein
MSWFRRRGRAHTRQLLEKREARVRSLNREHDMYPNTINRAPMCQSGQPYGVASRRPLPTRRPFCTRASRDWEGAVAAAEAARTSVDESSERQQERDRDGQHCERSLSFGARYCNGATTYATFSSRVRHNLGRPHASLGQGISDGAVVDPPGGGSNRHLIPAGCRIVATRILGGLHHEYWLSDTPGELRVLNICGSQVTCPTRGGESVHHPF